MLVDRELDSFDRELALYGQFDSEPVERTAKSTGQARTVSCGPFHAVEVFARNLVSRRRTLPRPWGDHAILMVQHDGETLARQYNHQTWLRRGDIYLMDTQAPLELLVPAGSHATCIAVARAAVAALGSRPEAIFGSKIGGGEGFPRMTWHFLAGLLGDRHVYDVAESDAVTATLQLILSKALKCPARSVDMLAHGQLLARIKEWIVRNLDDPALDAAVIARHFGLSRSGLYRLFAVEGESPGAWLTARRLDEAHLILSDGSRRDGTITTVCYRLGFNDPAHFSRLFRKRFGLCPREARRTGGALQVANGRRQ